MRVGGSVAATCPSPAHQVVLDLADDAANAFTLEPPRSRLHLWDPAAGLVSHTAFIGEFDGPYPFHGPGGALIDRRSTASRFD